MEHRLQSMDGTEACCSCGHRLQVSRSKYLKTERQLQDALLDAFNTHKEAGK